MLINLKHISERFGKNMESILESLPEGKTGWSQFHCMMIRVYKMLIKLSLIILNVMGIACTVYLALILHYQHSKG